jgi:hypothetical protein
MATIVAFHAHPDDEVLLTGGTIARLAAEGHRVIIVVDCVIFARELYSATADGLPLEASLAEARGAIRDAGNPTEWGTPVLYSRSPDGYLFDIVSSSGQGEAVGPVSPPPAPRVQANPRRRQTDKGRSQALTAFLRRNLPAPTWTRPRG